MDRTLYKEKVKEHIKINLQNHTYFHWKDGSIQKCRSILEPKFNEIRIKLNHFLAHSKNVCRPLKQEPWYMIARLYMHS